MQLQQQQLAPAPRRRRAMCPFLGVLLTGWPAHGGGRGGWLRVSRAAAAVHQQPAASDTRGKYQMGAGAAAPSPAVMDESPRRAAQGSAGQWALGGPRRTGQTECIQTGQGMAAQGSRDARARCVFPRCLTVCLPACLPEQSPAASSSADRVVGETGRDNPSPTAHALRCPALVCAPFASLRPPDIPARPPWQNTCAS